MVWGLAAVALVAFLLAFASHSAGWMGFGICIGFLCGIVAALLFIDRHMRASARPEHMSRNEVEALRNTVRKPHGSARQLPPTEPH